jgi:formylglycine-generating enzyme
VRSSQYLIFLFGLLGVACRTASAEVQTAPFTVGAADGGAVETTAFVAPAVTPPVVIADAPKADSACPAGMVLVDGDYCPDVEQRCLEWMDPPGPYQFFRCKRYAQPAACKSKQRRHERFCIDDKERVEPGTDLPRNQMSWTMSKKLCESEGARLCLTREWVFACEGEEMRPYPYGWERDSAICNADIDHGLGRVGRLVDHRAPASAHPECLSAFGLHDMAGNVDEWTTIEGAPRGSREVMHGSWWMPGRNSCRSFQGGHGPLYEGTETGTRCCADPR